MKEKLITNCGGMRIPTIEFDKSKKEETKSSKLIKDKIKEKPTKTLQSTGVKQ